MQGFLKPCISLLKKHIYYCRVWAERQEKALWAFLACDALSGLNG